MVSLLVLTVFLTSWYGLIMPLTKSDGSLDLSSLQSHIALLEQTLESKASNKETADLKTELEKTQTELRAVQLQLTTNQVKLQTTQDELKEVKSDLKATQTRVADLELQLKSTGPQTTPALNQPSKDITKLKTDVSSLKTDVFQLQSQRNATDQGKDRGGAMFTRWGRTTCPSDTKTVYKGYTGGTYYTAKASTATILCLPSDPIYAAHTSGGHGAYVYGTEYTTNIQGNPFKSLDDDDMPCAVCENENKRSVIMLPARNQCYPDWKVEYWGYLMGAPSTHASAEYICVDKDAEAVPGGQADIDGLVLYIVESACESLPCPPYENHWELTCAVCSK